MRRLLLLLSLLFISYFGFGQGSVTLTWNPSTDNVGVAGYCVWVDGERYDSTINTQYEYYLPAGEYMMTVSAYDAAGNESEQSEGLSVIIADVTVPAIPELLSLQYFEKSVRVSWIESSDNVAVEGYRIYMNGTLIDSTYINEYVIEDMIPDENYGLSISAFDAAGNESARTKEFDITLPINELEMKVYPNPVSKGVFKVLFDNGTIKENSIITIVGLDGKTLYEELVPAGQTPYEMEFNLEYVLVDGIFGVILFVDGKRTLNAYLVVTKPKYYSAKYLLEYLELEK